MDCDILVLDDDELVLDVTIAALEDAGYSVGMADNAAAALDFFESGKRCRLFVADINLGEKRNGFAVVVEARRRHPDLKVVYYSGLPSNWQGHRFVESDRHLSKPFRFEELLKAVQGLEVWPSMPPVPGAERTDF